MLALDHPFRVGDRVKLASGEGGEVLEIGMRATQIRLADGSPLFVPNAELVSSRLTNQTQGDAVRGEVRLTVPVTLDLDRLTEALLDEVQRLDPAALERPRPRVNLLTVSDKVELAIVLWLPRHANAEIPRLEDTLRRAACAASRPCCRPRLPPPRPQWPHRSTTSTGLRRPPVRRALARYRVYSARGALRRNSTGKPTDKRIASKTKLACCGAPISPSERPMAAMATISVSGADSRQPVAKRPTATCRAAPTSRAGSILQTATTRASSTACFAVPRSSAEASKRTPTTMKRWG